jgi:anti-sigma regulatory factor (Ser/Thr protein kinase)
VAVVLLAPDEHAAAQARRFARGWLADRAVPSRVVDDIELVVAELVSNAVRHGAPPFELNLYQTNGVIRGEVRDGSMLAPSVNLSPDHFGGFGLCIVAACTARWGMAVVPTGKRVWFEIESKS